MSPVVKKPSATAGDTAAGATGLIPGLRRSPRVRNSNSLQYSCWKILWTEEPGRLPSMGPQRVGHN